MKILVIYLIFIFAISCDYTADNDVFTLPRENYNGNQLRVDGYYYSKNDGYFFYRNGVFFDPGGGYGYIGKERWEAKSIDKKYLISLISESWWGQFVIQDSIIKFEMYYPGDGPLWSYIKEGIILNDTTFHITKSYRSNGTMLSEENEVYHFRKFSPKPDSTNVFVK